MTFDERIDRLTERHEALAQSLELLTKDVRALADSDKAMRAFVSEIANGTARLLSSVQGLATIAENHERRPTRLEG